MSITTVKNDLPLWAETIRQKYLSGESHLFVLYGNVFDCFVYDKNNYSLIDFLTNVLLKKNKEKIYEISLDKGLKILKGGTPTTNDELYRRFLNKNLSVLFEYLSDNIVNTKNNAVVIPYANTILPSNEHMLSLEERSIFVALHRWSLEEKIASQNNVIFLIAEGITSINQSLLSNPKVSAIELPVPDYDSRKEAIGYYSPAFQEDELHHLADITSGLRIVQLSNIVSNNNNDGLSMQQRISFIGQLLEGSPDANIRAIKLASVTASMSQEEIRQIVNPEKSFSNGKNQIIEMEEIIRKRKKELIEKECFGLIEFIEPKYGLDTVGGNEHIKKELLDIAKSIKDGNKKIVPMGILAVGPMGAGKTFVIKSFLKDAGITGVILKNFRSKWVGSTESNLERVLSTVKAMGPIALVIDEGDRSFGNAEQEGDSGINSRVIARLKEFMSDPENRGVILFILMTNRPDKLDTDIKRPGRLDKKIPFFYAETSEERAEIIEAILKRYDCNYSINKTDIIDICLSLDRYSNADLEAMVLLSQEFAERVDKPIDKDIMLEASIDFIPPREIQMLEYMEYQAAFETSRRSLLPNRFKNKTTEEIQNKILELKTILGGLHARRII